MKITFTMIVFNGEYVIKQLLTEIYKAAYKIVIVDGVVEYWAQKGFTGSVDNTIKIIESFPDPDNKIVLHKNVVAKEKSELSMKFMESVPQDTDYMWIVDSDEIYKRDDIETVIEVLKTKKPDLVYFKPWTFFGGFEYILTGFERSYPYKRILKFEPGCKFIEHRPPTLSCEPKNPIVITNDEMEYIYKVSCYHYSYVFPKQVKDKVGYYKARISLHNCIDNYFEKIWLNWVFNEDMREQIENVYDGVHEFIPSYRGECRTAEFKGTHPVSIRESMNELIEYHKKMLDEYR